ncbi:MAG TPA: exosortase system-associated protein, TIGR04073 family [Candidatus Omnitrophota bacterium]|nr:exosortase system-associated protein, TIGR04073 family [Candidatus Omnitrophota bacterium]HPD84440.1 exosortase system-associated protein, TIGR04073 family [Candidatus Omnitrophota bacterium]HRZ03298.1 exosortase system-associated protein, TIGR04073 family [Candidatus Omnitrophota bacterium]
MKKLILFYFVCLCFYATPLLAADSPAAPAAPDQNTSVNQVPDPVKITVQNPADKLGRGIVNIITSPIEIAKQVDLSWKQSAKSKSQATGIVTGFFKGLAYTVGRMGSGIWDVVSFPFKTPENYEPLMKPEFVLDEK